jgi:transcriptional regulator with XRE-family HTH domain
MAKLKSTQTNKALLRAIAQLGLSMSMEELGNKMGFGKATVSKYLSGSLAPSENFLRKFETVFDVELINYETTPPERTQIILHREKTDEPPKLKITASQMDEINYLKDHIITLKQLLEAKDFINSNLKDELEMLRQYPKRDSGNSKSG